jgi:hypothetical protein
VNNKMLRMIATTLRLSVDDDDENTSDGAYFVQNVTTLPVTFLVAGTPAIDGHQPYSAPTLDLVPFQPPPSHLNRRAAGEGDSVKLQITIPGYVNNALCDVGRSGLSRLSATPSPSVSKRQQRVGEEQFFLNVEDVVHGKVCVTIYTSLTCRNNLPFDLSVKLHAGASVHSIPKGKEIGLVSSRNESLSVLVQARRPSQLVKLSTISSAIAVECAPVVDPSSWQQSAPREQRSSHAASSLWIPCPAGVSRVYHSVGWTESPVRMAVSAETLGGANLSRRVVDISPCITLINNLRGTILDVVLDDNGTPGGRLVTLPRWSVIPLNSSSIRFSHDHMMFAMGVAPESCISVIAGYDTYRFSFQERNDAYGGNAWAAPVTFRLKNVPGAEGKVLFQERRRMTFGLVDLTGAYDKFGSLCISVSSHVVIRNQVPGVCIRIASTKTRVAGDPAVARRISKALTLSLNMQNVPRRNAIAIAPDGSAHFNSTECYIGANDEWSRRTLIFPVSPGESARIRIQSGSSSAELNLVAELHGNNEIRVFPHVLVTNWLGFAVRVFGGSVSSSQVAAGASMAFHHQRNILDGPGPPKLYIAAEGLFEQSGPIRLDRNGSFCLAVRRTPARRRNELFVSCLGSADVMHLGVDLFKFGGRRVLRLLPRPRYGPQFRVVNYSSSSVVLLDGRPPAVVCVIPGGSGVGHFGWLYGEQDHLSMGMEEDWASRGMAALREIHIPDREVVRSSVEFDGILSFPTPPIQLGIQFGHGNGFMRDVSIYNTENYSSSSRLRKTLPFSFLRGIRPYSRVSISVDHEMFRHALKEPTSAVHFSLPLIDVTILSGVNEELVSLDARGIRGEILSSDTRLGVAIDISAMFVKNRSASAIFGNVLERLPGSDACEPVFSLRSKLRLPHSLLNPSDLIFFETWQVAVRPLVVRLVSRYLRSPRHCCRKLFSLSKLTLSVQFVILDVTSCLGVVLSGSRGPVYFAHIQRPSVGRAMECFKPRANGSSATSRVSR